MQKRLVSVLPLLLIGVLLCTGAEKYSPARGSTRSVAHISAVHTLPGNGSLTRQQVVAQDQPAVVEVLAVTAQGNIGFGSGEIIDQRGYIVTNYHVVKGGSIYYVQLFDNSLAPVQLTGIDPADDLAVLKLNTTRHLPVLSFGNSSRLQVGESVMAIGFPEIDLINGIDLVGIVDGSTVTGGLISALGRHGETPDDGIIDAIQTDAELNSGNSGGALINMQARLIGIPTQGLMYEGSGLEIKPGVRVITPRNRPIKGIGFAIPSNRVAFVAGQLITYGRMIHSGHATIKAIMVSVTPALARLNNLVANRGAYISAVERGGPAALAGLRRGDVIMRVNNTPITNELDVTDALMPLDAGTRVTLGIMRGSRQLQVKTTLQELSLAAQATPTPQSSSASTPVVGKG
jgi:S1-C subfamily serine protease